MSAFIRYQPVVLGGSSGGGGVTSVGLIDSQTKSANGGVIGSSFLYFQTADPSFPGLVSIDPQDFSGVKTFLDDLQVSSSFLPVTDDSSDIGDATHRFSTTYIRNIYTEVVDVIGSGGTDALAIGTVNADVINIGRPGATINIQGSTLYENVVQLQVTDPLITLNKGGGAGSGANSGIEVEESGSISAYATTSSDRNSWTLKAPNTAGIAVITPGVSGIVINQSSHDAVTLTAVGSTPNANAASLTGQALTLQPADGTNPGVITAGTQTIGGAKMFSASLAASGGLVVTGTSALAAASATSLSVSGTSTLAGTTATSLSVSGTTTLNTGLTGPLKATAGVVSASAINLASSEVTGILPNANTTATNANTPSTIVARDGSGNFAAGTITAAVTGTASGNTTITPSNHAVVISSASNTLSTVAPSATSGVPLISQGASADPAFGQLNLASTSIVTGTLPVGNGGTGANTLASNSVILGNGTAAVQTVAPGASGNVLTSNGSTWSSQPNSALTLTAPSVRRFTATGTTTGYLFTISTSSTVAVGDTYTNNGNTYTVLGALTAQTGQVLFMSQAAAPLASGTLTRATGAGTASITYTSNVPLATYTPPTSPAPLWVEIEMTGGGGGGGAASTTSGIGTAGTVSIFGANIINCGAGGPGDSNAATAGGGTGGTATVASSGTVQIVRADSGPFGQGSQSPVSSVGGQGGSNAFGGAGAGGFGGAQAGKAAIANTGAGGGGGGGNASGGGGAGGGAGGYAKVIMSSLATSYPYIVGVKGLGGSPGITAGGNGADGIIIIKEFYQ